MDQGPYISAALCIFHSFHSFHSFLRRSRRQRPPKISDNAKRRAHAHIVLQAWLWFFSCYVLYVLCVLFLLFLLLLLLLLWLALWAPTERPTRPKLLHCSGYASHRMKEQNKTKHTPHTHNNGRGHLPRFFTVFLGGGSGAWGHRIRSRQWGNEMLYPESTIIAISQVALETVVEMVELLVGKLFGGNI